VGASVGVSVRASVGAAVGSGFPPQATRITTRRSRVPRSKRVFFIDIYDILLSMGFEERAFTYFDGRHLLANIKDLSRVLISPLC
jgi:hypothetical protein